MAAQDPIQKLCFTLMNLFVLNTITVSSQTPFGQARERLGERYLDVVTEGLRKEVKALLTTRAQEVLAMLEVQRGSELVVHEIMANVIEHVIASGKVAA